MAPSTGQEKSVEAGTCRTVSTACFALSVAGRSWPRVPETSLPWWAREARSGSANGRATTFLPWTAASRELSHRSATALLLPWTGLPPGLRTR